MVKLVDYLDVSLVSNKLTFTEHDHPLFIIFDILSDGCCE